VDGWLKQAYFVFLILSRDGKVAGSLDIKTSSKESAEIGYWCSIQHRGLMTNAVRALVSLAVQAGYQSLFAKVRLDNPASMGVLERAGFRKDSNWNDDPMKSRFLSVPGLPPLKRVDQ
jgi:RimJ/RimL family protein N-acetyltransferase